MDVPSELRSTPKTELLLAGLMLAGMGVTSIYLLPFWRDSAELSHGYFAPALSAWLFWLSRSEPVGFSDSARRGINGLMTTVFLLLLPIAGMAALAQGAEHSQTAFLVALTFTVFLVGGLTALSGSKQPLIVLNGASLCGAALWIFASPLPSGTLSRLTLLLQDQVTGVTLLTLRLFGIPAMRHGNVLELAQQFVGVEEACSGIRSLIACLFAGVFLGGLLLRGIWPRVMLVVAAGCLAVGANLLRSVLLCVLVSKGIDINGSWHDGTAYAILGLTVILLYAGCNFFAPDHPTMIARPAAGSGLSRRATARQLGLAVSALSITALVFWRTQPGALEASRPIPDLAALMDLDVPGWKHASNPQIVRFADALNTRYLHEETYLRDTTQVTFYMAYWPAGQSTLGSVGLHTPDLCMPGAGWTQMPIPPPLDAYPLPKPTRFDFQKNNYPQSVWFWHYYGGHLVEPLPGLYPWQLAPYLLKRPVSSSAAQWVIRVSSDKPLEALVDEPLLKAFFAGLKTAHLTNLDRK